jgi:hypothetical protein
MLVGKCVLYETAMFAFNALTEPVLNCNKTSARKQDEFHSRIQFIAYLVVEPPGLQQRAIFYVAHGHSACGYTLQLNFSYTPLGRCGRERDSHARNSSGNYAASIKAAAAGSITAKSNQATWV